MKRAILVMLALILPATLLVGCGKNAAPKQPDEPAQDAAGTLNQIPGEEDQTPAVPETPIPGKEALEGKKIIFIGNSHTYYGKTVLVKDQSVLTQSQRSNDAGYFYQLCKANGVNVKVTNWTFGNHTFDDLFVKCAANRGCNDVDHASYLTDPNYDYVVMQQGSREGTPEDFISKCSVVMDFFKAANPDVKFVLLVQRTVHENNYAWLSAAQTLSEQGVLIADWGKLVNDVIAGTVEVPGAAQTYNQNSFIVCKSASDGYHPNMLTGYLTTLMTYCAITGESAVGQPYDFCTNTSIHSAFNTLKFINTYYTYQDAKTNFADIFASEADMKGLQQLADQYLAEYR